MNELPDLLQAVQAVWQRMFSDSPDMRDIQATLEMKADGSGYLILSYAHGEVELPTNMLEWWYKPDPPTRTEFVYAQWQRFGNMPDMLKNEIARCEAMIAGDKEAELVIRAERKELEK